MKEHAPMRIKLNPSFWTHLCCVPFSEDVSPSSLFLKHTNYLVFDIETQHLIDEVGGWRNLEQLGVSVVCAYDSKTDQFYSYLEKDLPQLFRLLQDRLVIGYNIRGFDLPILGVHGLNWKTLDVFDLMVDLELLTRQKFLKLETVAQGTLGVGKSAEGTLAVKWWKEGKVQKIIEYCMQDVKITKDVFEYGRKHGEVFLKRADGSRKKVWVQWN